MGSHLGGYGVEFLKARPRKASEMASGMVLAVEKTVLAYLFVRADARRQILNEDLGSVMHPGSRLSRLGEPGKERNLSQ